MQIYNETDFELRRTETGRLSMNQKTKLLIGKTVVYVLLVISIFTYGMGWLTFEDKDIRKTLRKSSKEFVEEFDDMDKDDLETLQENFDDNEIHVNAKSFAKRFEKMAKAFNDAAVSPGEVSTVMSSVNDLKKIAEGESGMFFSEKDAEEYAGTITMLNIVSKVMRILTVVAILASIFFIVRGSFAGPIPYAVMAILNFIMIMMMKLKIEDNIKDLAGMLGSLGASGIDKKTSLKLLPPSYLTFIFALLACGVWIWLRSESVRSRVVIPGLYSKIKKTGQENLNKESLQKGMNMAHNAASKLGGDVMNRVKEASAGAMADGSYCPKCGKALKAGEAFCGFCGEPVVPAGGGAKCPACGTPVQPGEAFCPECGTRLAEQPKMRTDTVPQQAIVAADRVDPAPAKNQTVLLEDEPVMPRATLTLGDSVYDIDKARFAIGRDAGDLIIAGDHVSHEHCEITFTNGTFCVTDLKSSNHTYVNGTMIAPYEPKALADGDAIRFADIDAIFHVG